MLRAVIQWLKRIFLQSRPPLAVFIDATGSSTVRYELYPRFICRTSVYPRDPQHDAIYFMSGLQPDACRIQDSIGLSARDRPPTEQIRLENFLNHAVTCVVEFEKAGIPPFAPMATPGINDIFFTKGQEFITTKKIPVLVHIGYFAPCSGGGAGKLPAGVRLRITEDSVDYATSTSCEVLEPYYSALEKSLVSRHQPASDLYAGYSLSIENQVLRDCCTPALPEPASGEPKFG